MSVKEVKIGKIGGNEGKIVEKAVVFRSLYVKRRKSES